MPLITCPDCGNQVSDRAAACPKCGAPVQSGDAASSVEVKKVNVSFDDTVKSAGKWLGALVLIGAVIGVLRAIQAVVVDVKSCEIDHGEAKIAIRYHNRSAKPVTLSYDLVLARDRPARRSSGGGYESLKSSHVAGIILAAAETREEVLSISVPETIVIANPIVVNLSYISN